MTTDLPEDPGPGGAALDALSRALTAPPGDGELSGEAAALAMFRAVRPPGHGPVPRFQRRARTLVAAAGIALAGCTAAAYAAVLPAQVQHAAYQVLGFIGVPDARPGGPSHPRPAAGRPVTSPAPARRGSRSPGSASASSSASNQAGPPGAAGCRAAYGDARAIRQRADHAGTVLGSGSSPARGARTRWSPSR